MFGELVVEGEKGQLGYLAACSGKIADTNQHTYFVPPIFDMLTKDSFFLQEEEQINTLNRQIDELEASPDLAQLLQQHAEAQQNADAALSAYRIHMKAEKTKRKKTRTNNKPLLSEADYQLLESDLIKQRYPDQHEYALLNGKWQEELASLQTSICDKQQQIEELKRWIKLKSTQHPQPLFKQGQFLDAHGKTKS